MKSLKAKLGYTGAGLTLFAAVLVPFVLWGVFSKGFASLGLHVDEVYSGGPTVRTIQGTGYTIDVHREVIPHFFQRENPFVELAWKPVGVLPPRISERVDIDGNGTPDVLVSFDVPKDPKAMLHVDVESLNPRYESMRNVGKEKFSRLIVRVDDAILVRIPVAEP